MSSDPRDYKLDLSSAPEAEPASKPAPGARPFLSVLFDCCNVYQRVYRDRSGNAYSGRCPRCGRSVRFPVGEDGTPNRFFRAS